MIPEKITASEMAERMVYDWAPPVYDSMYRVWSQFMAIVEGDVWHLEPE